MFEQIEAMNQCWWGHKVSLATTAHTVGGIGLGLLLYPILTSTTRTIFGEMVRPSEMDRVRTVAYGLLGLSALAHVYAFFTRYTAGVTAEREAVAAGHIG